MTEPVATAFEAGFQRYQAGEAPESLIPTFKGICDRAPKNATAWACLAWLYLLADRPQLALKAAQKGVRLDPRAPQGRVNLALAMLETGTAGVRSHIEAVRQAMAGDAETRQSVAENLEDGLNRKPDWTSLQRVKNWLLND